MVLMNYIWRNFICGIYIKKQLKNKNVRLQVSNIIVKTLLLQKLRFHQKFGHVAKLLNYLELNRVFRYTRQGSIKTRHRYEDGMNHFAKFLA